jgi:hypothetical protein
MCDSLAHVSLIQRSFQQRHYRSNYHVHSCCIGCCAVDETIEVSVEDNDSDIDWNASASGAEFWDAL